MTTAARPTFEPAKGGSGRGEKSLSSLSKHYSSRDLPSHLKLKYRQHGQNTADDVKTKDFRKELEERERLAQLEKDGKRGHNSKQQQSSSSSSHSLTQSNKKPRIEYQRTANNLSQLDADEKLDDDDDDDDGGGGGGNNNDDVNSDSDEDSEDDTQALLAELNRIKRERAAEEAKREEEQRNYENKIRMENILSGNPLLNAGKSTNFKVKRRWDDDVVFKNCAKDDLKDKDKSFINDTLRSDFHKKFMEKYIK
ncbi:complexed with cef1p, variant 2 [Dermatophagoides farinae]|uniref:Complexed with cef1p, variant 2 n=1 Tax=Dermatophagoides farinae TaxID=6954 RepID=A0A922ICV7_DERFA|nr:protein CWC15 homolog [Dermatophagoides farinae]KAH7641248.1 protein cwc15 [Dermatophagoides farinae]KAH9526994.1 complexed with cef1p, variant 2 [Dermatophagoides farinae]